MFPLMYQYYIIRFLISQKSRFLSLCFVNAASVSRDRNASDLAGAIILYAGAFQKPAKFAVGGIFFVVGDNGICRLYAVQQSLCILFGSSVMRHFNDVIRAVVSVQEAFYRRFLNVSGEKVGVFGINHGNQQRHVVVVFLLCVVSNSAWHNREDRIVCCKSDFFRYKIDRYIIFVDGFYKFSVFAAVIIVIRNIDFIHLIPGKNLFCAADVILVVMR